MPVITTTEPTITISREEVKGSPVESSDQYVFSATLTWMCEFKDSLTLASQIIGFPVSAGQDIQLTLGEKYPHLGGNHNVRAKSYTTRPFFPAQIADGGSDKADYVDFAQASATGTGKALLEVQYDSEVDEHQHETFEPAAEFMTLPHEGLAWGSSPPSGTPLKPNEAPGKRVETMEWVIQYAKIPTGSLKQIFPKLQDAVGKVNQDKVVSKTLNHTFNEETLLFRPPYIEQVTLPDGFPMWRVTFRFSHRPQTWQRFWRNETGAWEFIFDSTGGKDVYEKTLFNDIRWETQNNP